MSRFFISSFTSTTKPPAEVLDALKNDEEMRHEVIEFLIVRIGSDPDSLTHIQEFLNCFFTEYYDLLQLLNKAVAEDQLKFYK